MITVIWFAINYGGPIIQNQTWIHWIDGHGGPNDGTFILCHVHYLPIPLGVHSLEIPPLDVAWNLQRLRMIAAYIFGTDATTPERLGCLGRRLQRFFTMFAMENNTIYWMICDTPIKMLIFHSKVWVLIGGLNGSNMPHGLDRLCPTMLPCCIWQAWTLREGQEAKWIGEKTADGRTYYWSRKSCSGKTLCAVQNGLGIPQFQTVLGVLVLECTRYIWSQQGIPRCDDLFFCENQCVSSKNESRLQ